MRKPYIIFLDAQDRGGKSSLLAPLFAARGKLDLTVDRGPVSNYVYSKMYEREVDLSDYLRMHQNPHIVTIYLDVDEKELARRTIESNDYHVKLEDIPKHKVLFNETVALFIRAGCKIITVKVTNETVEELVKKIAKIVDEL